MEDTALITKLAEEKRIAIEYQSRRHEAWRQIYAFYRNIVETNALTQRQATNIPIMKETKKTLSSRIDEPPTIKFDCLEKGEPGREKEMVVNEIWDDDYDKCNFEIIDTLQKDNVLLYGRTFCWLNFAKGKFEATVPDNLDVVIDPKTIPWDIETARFLIKLHIEKRLSDILADEKYTDKGKKELQIYLRPKKDDGVGGNIPMPDDKTKQSRKDIESDLELEYVDQYCAADVMLEINEHLTEIWDEKAKKYVRHIVTVAAENVILRKETLKEALGIEFWPVTTWADEVDTKDFWTDGMGDVVLVPNQIMNIYYSTMSENMVLSSLGMHWYLPVPGFSPQTFEPQPFGMYPAPLVEDKNGNYLSIEQVVKQMQVPALTQNLVNIDFLIRLVERATAATAIEKGVSEKKQITLGEVEKLVESTSERIVSIAKFYKRAWKEFAWKWRKIREANDAGALKLYKKSVKGNYYEKEVYNKDWVSEKGYKERVVSSSEQEAEQLRGLQKLNLIATKYPNSLAIQKIVKRRMLEIVDISPDELREVEAEEKMAENIPPIPPITPQNKNLATTPPQGGMIAQ